MRVAVAIVVLAGCGRIGFAPQANATPQDDAPRADAFATVCGPGYAAFPGVTSLYRIGPATAWLKAEADCESDGGHLIVIDDSAENAWAATNAPTGVAWIGSSDHVTEGTFRWVTGAPMMFTSWDPAEPNNSINSEDCAQTFSNHLWNDARCQDVLSYICECDRVAAAIPSTYCDTEAITDCGACGTVCATGCSVQVCN
jgi:hypothetical protein